MLTNCIQRIEIEMFSIRCRRSFLKASYNAMLKIFSTVANDLRRVTDRLPNIDCGSVTDPSRRGGTGGVRYNVRDKQTRRAPVSCTHDFVNYARPSAHTPSAHAPPRVTYRQFRDRGVEVRVEFALRPVRVLFGPPHPLRPWRQQRARASPSSGSAPST